MGDGLKRLNGLATRLAARRTTGYFGEITEIQAADGQVIRCLQMSVSRVERITRWSAGWLFKC